MTVVQHPSSEQPQSLEDAIAEGDYFNILLAQRREIIATLPEEKGQSRASLHRLLTNISREINDLEALNNAAGSVVKHSDDEPWNAAAI